MVVSLAVGTALVASFSPAWALGYDVTQSGSSLGTITPFSSAETAADFYRFGIPHTYSGEPLGVPLSGDSSVLYIHLDTNTGIYSLGWIHGKEGEGPLRYLQGTVEITPDAVSPGVDVSDDPGALRFDTEDHLAPGFDEFFADGTDPLLFYGDWRWGPNRTDGGAVGPIGTTPGSGGATATITSLDRTGEDLSWLVASADGSVIPLTVAEDSPARLTATPELPPFALAGLGMPLVWLRNRLRRNRKKK
ncbi:MAG: hypothetical protein ACE5JM_15755 [Armatimonadota bacterium]